MDITLALVIAVALFFDFTNGFHDTANAIATIVSTKALTPRQAVIMAAILNFIGAFVSLKVAATVAKGIVDPGAITLSVVLAGVAGAIIWNLTTWRFGMPSSSSHALIGGVAGASIASAGFSVIKWEGLREKVLVPSLVAPFLGLAGAAVLMFIIIRIVRNRPDSKVNAVFRRLQLISGGFVAFTHGTNDAQKTMGIIALALIAANPGQAFHVPVWVIFASATTMAVGTYFGGWRIIKTLGEKITELSPKQGFAAETSTASTLFLTAHYGFPVSTTHTISGSILGAGVASKPYVVRWKVVRHILLAWLFTIPCAALVGALLELFTRLPGGTGIAFVMMILIASGIYFTRNWTWESRAQLRSLLAVIKRRRQS